MFRSWMGEGVMVENITPDDIFDFFTYLEEVRQLKTKSLIKDLSIYKIFFGWLADNGVICKSLTTALESLRFRRYSSRPFNDTKLNLPCSLREGVNNYIKARQSKAIKPIDKRTLDGYSKRLRYFQCWMGEEISVRDITTEDIRRYLSYLYEYRHYKLSSRITEAQIIRVFFRWLVNSGMIGKNPITANIAQKSGGEIE